MEKICTAIYSRHGASWLRICVRVKRSELTYLDPVVALVVYASVQYLDHVVSLVVYASVHVSLGNGSSKTKRFAWWMTYADENREHLQQNTLRDENSKRERPLLMKTRALITRYNTCWRKLEMRNNQEVLENWFLHPCVFSQRLQAEAEARSPNFVYKLLIEKTGPGY